MSAYGTMISAPLPDKTETYTPIAHSKVITKIRSEIAAAGFKITGEEYKCSNDGEVALGTLMLNYKEDPNIELACSFLNSYNKQYAFRFNLGGINKETSGGMILNEADFGMFKRVHTGTADVLADGAIADYIADAGAYWDHMVSHKEHMKSIIPTVDQQYVVLGSLFFHLDILNGMQLNIVRRQLEKPKGAIFTVYELYNYVAMALKQSHPAAWLEHHAVVHSLFASVFSLPTLTYPHMMGKKDESLVTAKIEIMDLCEEPEEEPLPEW